MNKPITEIVWSNDKDRATIYISEPDNYSKQRLITIWFNDTMVTIEDHVNDKEYQVDSLKDYYQVIDVIMDTDAVRNIIKSFLRLPRKIEFKTRIHKFEGLSNEISSTPCPHGITMTGYPLMVGGRECIKSCPFNNGQKEKYSIWCSKND